MKRHKNLTWGLALACLVALPLVVNARTKQLPISAFLDVQPLGWWHAWRDPATHRILRFDAFGKSAEYFGVEGLGTTFEGSVTVRELADGRAHVTVLLHTKKAICWGYQLDELEMSALEAFGYAPALVAEDATPSLGDGLFSLEFLMPSAGSSLPNYFQVTPENPDYPRLALSAVINCRGELRDGSGYPDGTPGRAHTTQIGLFATGVPSGCPPERGANCYPSEKIEFRPTGPR